MDDLISRQAAIHEIHKQVWLAETAKTFLTEALNELPSAQERKTGRWIRIGYIEHTYLVSKCSVCGYRTIDAGNYCTNCSADMRGERWQT